MSLIEKSGPPDDIGIEVEILRWCAGRVPVPRILSAATGTFSMSVIDGVDLTETPTSTIVHVLVEALSRLHALDGTQCPFDAGWSVRLRQAEQRVATGQVDEADFDENNAGRTAEDILRELLTLPAPPARACFTHGDACLPNFLTDGVRLTGMVDMGRAGIAHPAQDWALALRSMLDNRGLEAANLLRQHLPDDCADEQLLRQFRLLDELF